MRTSLRLASFASFCLVVFSASFAAADGPSGNKISVASDVRFGPLKDYDGYFPFTPPKSLDDWKARREDVRRQILVAEGLWPMPTKTPLNPIVHGRVERDGYTIDRVAIETFPGHYLCGSLYSPKKLKDKNPVVLCPHGHWKDGRFYDAGEDAVRKQIAVGAERFEIGGRYPLQARCVQLARMGCIVFHYDMEGVADTIQLSHAVIHRYGEKRPEMETKENWGFYSPQAESRLQSVMGLQTWNNIRALDFALSLPKVDPTRVGVTGASGGGTQTMILGAIDDRVTAIVPAVMVSTSMQGGCTCENTSLLRVGTGNIEFAALFAPKPQALLAANDWTREIMTKGFPELQQLYALYGAKKGIEAHAFTHYPHNYNHVSRAAMYSFFNREFKLGVREPVLEEDYEPLSVEELTVWTGEHKQPPGGDDHERKLVRHMTEDSEKLIAKLTPTDAASLKEYRRVVGGGIDSIIGRRLEDVGEVEQENLEETDRGAYVYYRCKLASPRHNEIVTATYYYPKQWNNQVVVWLDAKGTAGLNNTGGEPIAAVADLVKAGYAVAGVDLLGQGDGVPSDFPRDANRRVPNKRLFTGYTYGFNHPLLVQRVHDVLTVVAHAKANHHTPEKIHLVGLGAVGPIAAVAAAQCGDALDRAAIDTADFRFADLTDYLDASFVPGVVKYGDVPALLALAAPTKMLLSGEGKAPAVVQAAYAAASAENDLTVVPNANDGAAVAKWLMAK
jgi:dienelactone hydrolase